MDKKNVVIGLVVLIIVAAVGYMVIQTEEDTPTDVDEEQKLVVGTTDTARTLDPADSYDTFGSRLLKNTGNTLVGYEPGTDNLEGKLAVDWNIEEEGEIYNLELRDDVYFHNGEHMTAEDVKFSLERARDLGGMPSSLLENMKDVEIVDDYEINIHLESPSITFLSVLAYTVATVVPEGEYPYPDDLEEIGEEEEIFSDEVVSTGAYELASWNPGESVRLVENEDYWGQQPHAEEVEILIYDNSEELRQALENGEIDIVYRELDPVDRELVRESEDLVHKEFESMSIDFLVLDVTQEPIADLNVRKAISYALDRDEINDEIYMGERLPLHSLVPEGMMAHKPVFEEQYGAGSDIEQARAMLEEAGYSEEDPLELTLWTPDSDLRIQTSEKIAEQLKRTDMAEIEVGVEDWDEFQERMGADIKFHIIGWEPDFFDPDNFLTPFLETSSAEFLGSHYSDEEMDQMLAEQIQIIDYDERVEKLENIQEKLAGDVPYLPLLQAEQFASFQEDVDEDSVELGPVQIFRYYTIRKEGWN